ncbi:MAG TPA: vWA domain-containing protein [Thermoanaerobaculia bacterium]
MIWIGAGVALFRWYARPSGSDFKRAADRALVPVGGNVRVSLQLTPPSATAPTTVDPHDVVLLLDHSPSMGDGPGSALSAAVRAAENFVRRCPKPIRVGLIIFDSSATTLSPITGDRAALLQGLESITAGNGTSIDAALAAATELIEQTSDRAARTTAILLSDGGSAHAPAIDEASRLREHAHIITIGFGDSADANLLKAIATDEGRYCHVADVGELAELFTKLAAMVSSAALTGIIEEPPCAPRPFQLAHTGTFHPVGVQGDRDSTIAWSVPVMDSRSVSLAYDLVPEHAGWHPVARRGGRAVWEMPDGTQQVMPAPEGPRVLVLPTILLWSWPILNPLFWMLFGWLFRRSRRDARVEIPVEEPELLTIPTLPAPLDPPQPALYETQVRPAVVVGLGDAGEWAVTHLGHLLADRGIAANAVTLLAVRASFDPSEESVRSGAFELAPADRIELRQDLRPYLETLRAGAPPVRRWIPAREWLGRGGPRTTDWVHDRREARLALLQRPEELETRIAAAVAALKGRNVDETALVLGSARDPECSGMLAEVAHMLSVAGAQTTAVISKPRISDGRGTNELDALAHELERMLLMRGDEVLSDRHDPPAAARQLLDRLVVLRDDATTPKDLGRGVADTVWQLLAYPELLRRVPMAKPDAARRQIECCAVEQTTTHLPAESLWRWVRSRTLARAVNGVWLGTTDVDEAVQVPAPRHEVVAKWVNAFWMPSGLPRPQGLLLRSGAGLLADAKNTSVLALCGRLPVEALYEEQAAFADRERKTVGHFVEAWCQGLLDEAYAQRQCGLPVLLAALREIENGFAGIQRRLAESAADQHLATAARLGTAFYRDLAAYVDRFRQNVETRLARLTGSQVALGVISPERDAVCARIDRMRRDAELDVIFPTQAVRDDAEGREGAWYQQYGAALLDQLRVRFVINGMRPDVALELAGQSAGDDFMGALEEFFAPYRAEVLSWPLAGAMEPAPVDQPGRRSRVGAASAHRHPDVADVADDRDPYIVGTLLVDRISVNEALRVSQAGVRRLPYAWPEEANAVRIAALVNNILSRRARPFSPAAVHLLRDTSTLHGFLADLAERRISVRNGRCWVSRDGGEYWIGEPALTATPLEAIANFEKMAWQTAVAQRSLDGREIPLRGDACEAAPEDVVARIESNSLVQSAMASEQWEMWKDVVRGVVLDAEAQRRRSEAGAN